MCARGGRTIAKKIGMQIKSHLRESDVQRIPVLAVLFELAHAHTRSELQDMLQNHPRKGMLPVDLVPGLLKLRKGRRREVIGLEANPIARKGTHILSQ